ncbi:MAG: transcription elongation factor subunit Spt4 [Candidatus Poseidoniaceae archaeon]|jgi:DNA-directed RNA polymerase subunit E"|nr:DNA-directed RNA polymerase subunit E'' [Euryarchaeota archaeon]MDP6232919.1 transcription elongation factor subunit Spt4 [Candidatus Poseidoniaceae archaeon]RJV02404.1 MAG: DNA-directed RNA polymerase subunit E'' [Candidatus Poseidoniales archaeon]
MPAQPFACGECHMILADKVDQCPRCPTARVSTDWQGFVIIMQPERSEIAKRLQVSQPGQYALKVNIY